MGNLLINESPLMFQPTLAVQLNRGKKRNGLQKAVIMQQLHFLSHGSPKVMDGHKWVSYNFDEWQDIFPFWTTSTIARLFSELVVDNLLISEYGDDDPFDRTKWHRINYSHPYILSGSKVISSKVDNRNKGEKEKERKSIYSEWEKLQPISPIVADALDLMVNDWNVHQLDLDENHRDKGLEGKDVVIDAIKEMARNGIIPPNVKYTEKIIAGWIGNGYKVDTRKKNTKKTTEGQKGNKGELYG